MGIPLRTPAELRFRLPGNAEPTGIENAEAPQKIRGREYWTPTEAFGSVLVKIVSAATRSVKIGRASCRERVYVLV